MSYSRYKKKNKKDKCWKKIRLFLLIALHDLATDKGKRSQPQVPQKDFQFAFNSTMHMLNRQNDTKRFSRKEAHFLFLLNLTMIIFGQVNFIKHSGHYAS